MAKYIDVESLVVGYSGHTPDDEFSKGVNFVLDLLDSKPPADVKPVVLCKDCDLWNEWDSSGRESLGTYRCSCAGWATEITTYYTGPDEFCSRGKRKEEDEE